MFLRFFKHILLSLIVNSRARYPWLLISLIKPHIQAMLTPAKLSALGICQRRHRQLIPTVLVAALLRALSPTLLNVSYKSPTWDTSLEFTAKKSSSVFPEELSIILSDHKDYVTVHAPVLVFSYQELGCRFETLLKEFGFLYNSGTPSSRVTSWCLERFSLFCLSSLIIFSLSFLGYWFYLFPLSVTGRSLAIPVKWYPTESVPIPSTSLLWDLSCLEFWKAALEFREL